MVIVSLINGLAACKFKFSCLIEDSTAMKFDAIVVVVLLLSGTFAAASGVVELTESNFDEMTKEGKWLVELYATVLLYQLPTYLTCY